MKKIMTMLLIASVLVVISAGSVFAHPPKPASVFVGPGQRNTEYISAAQSQRPGKNIIY